MHEVIIVDSGLAGTAAALERSEHGVRPLVLEVGVVPAEHREIGENLNEYRKSHDKFDLTIGAGLQHLSNLPCGQTVPVKLTAPKPCCVTAGAGSPGPLEETIFRAPELRARRPRQRLVHRLLPLYRRRAVRIPRYERGPRPVPPTS